MILVHTPGAMSTFQESHLSMSSVTQRDFESSVGSAVCLSSTSLGSDPFLESSWYLWPETTVSTTLQEESVSKYLDREEIWIRTPR